MSQELPYELQRPTAYEWTEKAYDLMIANALVVSLCTRERVELATATGLCPRCAHDVGFVMERNAPIPGHVGGLGQESAAIDEEYVPVDVVCRCAGTHPGRPADVATGCGIVFRAEVIRTEQ
ncbi:hypothetical protein ACFRAQ_10910 [Nocardia sp. NPDC056611]|uniref:hypothetical protein n=1 Tax=Nocardia sp. NPDC056611 TaxID=3345877 RepID=UPI00366CD427